MAPLQFTNRFRAYEVPHCKNDFLYGFYEELDTTGVEDQRDNDEKSLKTRKRGTNSQDKLSRRGEKKERQKKEQSRTMKGNEMQTTITESV